MLSLFNISHLSSTACTAAMAKRAQQESGEERVTAKSRPMMNLTARMPSVGPSSTSSPGKSVVVDGRSGKLDGASPPGFSKVDYGQSWSSQEWKSEAAAHDWSGKPETVNHQGEANPENFVMGYDAAEFVKKVKDQVRNRQKRISNVAKSGDEHSIIWGIFMATTLNAATFMGKNFSTIQSVVKNHEDLTLKQMFDVTAQLVINQEEIKCLEKILWGKNSLTRLSLIDDEIVINPQRTRVYVFSDSLLCFGTSTFRIQRSLEEQGCRSTIWEKLPRL